MIVLRDDLQEQEKNADIELFCGWDGDDSCGGVTGCSDLMCSGAVNH